MLSKIHQNNWADMDLCVFDGIGVALDNMKYWHLGPGCSKLTSSLVNDTLKFQTLISQIRQHFCRKNVRSFCSAKAFLIFSTKNISVTGYKVVKHLTSWPLNELVKLMMLWTTGPRCTRGCDIFFHQIYKNIPNVEAVHFVFLAPGFFKHHCQVITSPFT